MKRVGFFVFLSLLVNTACAQKFFSWPIYANSEFVKTEVCTDTIFLKDNRPILNYSKYNCSTLEIANDIAISLRNNGITKFCILPYSLSKLNLKAGFILEVGAFYSYLNFNIWDSRIDFQLFRINGESASKFDLISKVNSEKNNWGYKSGQKSHKNSFEAAMIVLLRQLQE